MRLSRQGKEEIKQQIRSDLFSVANTGLKERKVDIAKRNREYFLAPHMKHIDLIPSKLLNMSKMYYVRIKYNQDAVDPTDRFDETWSYTSDVRRVNPKLHNTWEDYKDSLAPELYTEASVLIQEILALRKEEKSMNHFLNTSMEQYNTDIQLRKVWPTSLHKYLPAPLPRKPKIKKEKSAVCAPVEIVVPDGLNTRLVTNLLEG